jgi:hypothetical protein
MTAGTGVEGRQGRTKNPFSLSGQGNEGKWNAKSPDASERNPGLYETIIGLLSYQVKKKFLLFSIFFHIGRA